MAEKTHTISKEEIFGEAMSRDEAMKLIQESSFAYSKFKTFAKKNQEDILLFMQGMKGLPILYDGFFKHVLDPERHPRRLEQLLSDLLGESVVIEEILTKESSPLTDGGTLVVMDIIVRLSDGSYVDVEMQKIGYQFPGERSSCYMSDMIMRQYNRVRRKEKQAFSFRHMKPVYLIIIMEKSSQEFQAVSPKYIHRSQYSFDSGAQLKLLSNLIYISLDTFRSVSHNINNITDAWLTFFSSDEADDIIRLVEKYPEFKECYRDIMKFRRKPEELMSMFSEALIEMDKNTVKYMIEEQQKELEKNKRVLAEQEKELQQSKETLARQGEELQQSKETLARQGEELQQSKETLKKQEKELIQSRQIAEEQKKQLTEKDAIIEELRSKLSQNN